MRRTSVYGDDTGQSLHAVADHRAVSRSAAGEPLIIQFPFQAITAAALSALEEATLPSTFESVGEVAVRLVGSWSFPRLVVWRGSREEGQPPRLPAHDDEGGVEP
jgi:hypothetical protein